MVFPGGNDALSSEDVADDRHPFLRPSSCELETIEGVSPNSRSGTESPSPTLHLSNHSYEGVAQEDLESRTVSLQLGPLPPDRHGKGDSRRGTSTPDIPNYKPPGSHKFVKWELILRQPIIMLLFATAGIGLAIGHHFYNMRLRGTKAGNEAAQQGQIWIGTAFSNSSIFFFNSAIAIAFVQAIWFEVRSQGFSVGTLDNLFGLDKDITGFFNWNLLRRAKVAILIGFIIWGMPLTVIVPPGTISVVPGTQLSNATQQIKIPSFNWTTEHDEGLLRFIKNSKTGLRFGNPYPQPLRLASIISQAASVNPPIGMIPNSTITQQFYGPALQCLPPNSTQQAAFDGYNDLVYAQDNTITVPKLLSGNYSKGYSQLQFFTAFSPQLYGYINDVDQRKGVPDHYNNWQAILPGLSSNTTQRSGVTRGAEFWIQLASKSIICSLTNASFDIAYESTGLQGTPTVIQRSVTHVNRWNYSSSTESYVGVMSALGAVLYGNVTVLWYDCNDEEKGKCFMSRQTNSQVLQTGLGACEGDDGFENSWWSQNLDELNRTHAPGPITFGNAGKSWMCRNGSIEKALEDLAINVTIGMLGVEAANFKPVYPIVNTTIWSLPNVYSYEAKNLIISYGVGIFATLCCIAIGLRLFISNGISHDSSFSALMTTTRNPDLDELSVGQSLSSIGKTLADTKLQFGWYTVEGGREDLQGLKRAAFGKVDKVGTLRKGDQYI